MKGRKPKPRSLRLIGGNASKRPLNPREAAADPALPRPPAHFREDNEQARIALREYRQFGHQLLALGLVAKIDGSFLALHADAYARWVIASRGLQQHGMLVKGRLRGEPVRSPYAALVNQAWDQLRQIDLEFGVGPSARSRVEATPPARVDPFQNFLNRGKTTKPQP